MADVLVIAEYSDGKVKKTTHSAVTAAKQAAEALQVPMGTVMSRLARARQRIMSQALGQNEQAPIRRQRKTGADNV